MPEIDKTNSGNGSSPYEASELSRQQTAQSHYGRYGPLARIDTSGTRLEAFGGELQPGLWKPVDDRKIANPAPLGLCGFALTTFVLGCIEMQTRDILLPNVVVGPALAYGGLVQLCAGMWYVPSYFPFCLRLLDHASKDADTMTGKWQWEIRLVLLYSLPTVASGCPSPLVSFLVGSRSCLPTRKQVVVQQRCSMMPLA